MGPEVRKHRVGDRVVVCSVIACGRCWYCEQGLFSCCDNGNTNPVITEAMYGCNPAGIFGYSHAMGGFKGSHAEYVRVPYADHIAFPVPDELDDQTAVFASDSAPTGWMGADVGGVRPGDVVAVWGCGAVGQMAARAAILLGAERVIAIDRFDYRLEMTEMNKGLTLRSAQQHGERYIPMLLERMARGELKTSHLETHPMPLDEGPRGYDLFKNKKEGCVRAVFQPAA